MSDLLLLQAKPLFHNSNLLGHRCCGNAGGSGISSDGSDQFHLPFLGMATESAIERAKGLIHRFHPGRGLSAGWRRQDGQLTGPRV